METKNLFLVKKNFSFFKVAIIMSLLVINVALSNAQVTVGSNTPPDATLDVVGQATVATIADGVIAPRLTGDQLKDKDAVYGSGQTGAIVYATAAVSAGNASVKTKNVISAGYYYFDGVIWQVLKRSTFNITPVQTSSYVIKVTDDVVLLDWAVIGHNITLPGEAEGTPVGKIVHISNAGSREGEILAGVTDVRVNALRRIDARTDYAFMYIGNNLWISMTGY